MPVDGQIGQRHLFVSYAGKDRAAIQPLLDGMSRLNYEVWVDRRLRGGQDWWEEILAQIQACDGLVAPISPSLLASEACTSERKYARDLAKPVLPVMVVQVPKGTIPADLAKLQIVDYTTPGAEAAFEFAGALAGLPTPPPLPNPLPGNPPLPKSYQYELADRINASTLDLNEQLAIVAQLREALKRADDREWGLELLRAMQQRRDLYRATDLEIADILDRVRPEPAPAVVVPRRANSSVPAGWYPDPSQRHQLRWFDGDWTSWAADGEVVVDDPDF
jgi:hypothetical protein